MNREKNKMKIVFLDFDGVLNSEKYLHRCGKEGLAIDPSKMVLLKQIIDAAGAAIVLTTSWREHWESCDEKCDPIGRAINHIFHQFDLRIFDKTPSLRQSREEEIGAWLKAHAEIESFAVLDDRFLDSELIRGHFVKTANYLDGLDETNVERVIELLS